MFLILRLCYFVRPFPTFFFNNFWLSVAIFCNNILCLSRANVDGKSLNDFSGSLQLEHCSRSNPNDGISGYFISLPIVLSNSQTCWQIVQYLPRAKWLGNFFIFTKILLLQFYDMSGMPWSSIAGSYWQHLQRLNVRIRFSTWWIHTICPTAGLKILLY